MKRQTLAVGLLTGAICLPVSAASANDQQAGKTQNPQKHEQLQPSPSGGQSSRVSSAQGTSQVRNRHYASVYGRIESARLVSLKGEQEKHVVAKLQALDGKTYVADLGTLDDLRNMRLARGEYVRVAGPAGRINGKPVIVADRIRDRDTLFTLVRIVPPQSQRNQQRQGGQDGQATGPASASSPRDAQTAAAAMRRSTSDTAGSSASGGRGREIVQGTILDLRTISLKGVRDKHLAAKIRTSSGSTRIVDLGPSKDLSDITLQRGETIAAVGSMGRIDGKPVLFANQVADVVTIRRPNRGSGETPDAQPASGGGGATTRPAQSARSS